MKNYDNDNHNYYKDVEENNDQETTYTFSQGSEDAHQDSIEQQESYTQPEPEQQNLFQEDSVPEKEPENQTQVKRSHQQPQSKGVVSMFVSGVAGGLVVAVTGASLLFTGVLELPTDNSQPTQTANSVTDDGTENNVIQASATDDGISLNTALANVSDAVVGVSNIRQADLWSQSDAAGTGSGVIYKKENGYAYVVTNNHVVEGANEVEVILTNGDHVEAEVLGVDQLTDLAVLKIDGSKVTQVATLGSSDSLTVGETAIAIGNPLGTEFAGSVTKGIISGLERSVEVDLNSDGQPDWTTEVIQTDAAINPGNSGGALINDRGELIGINSMKIAQAAVEGIGFAIPVDSAKPIIDQLETTGQVARPFIGISAVSLSTVPEVHKQQTLQLDDSVMKGIVIANREAGSPADQAGLEQYDVITKINGQDITTMMELKQYLYSETEIGEEITITYYRNGEQLTTSLTLSNS
ncbi:PDZ domain-containing protein [Aquibacillus halophilus]|uniref:PDZ domain-containing protein n=1 Tax=Aquibacillus halophilus TaxID=930132 RepID=A0A6A8DDB2_9BACI|nr:S1C family serine protease [Aquibacillus halophilus]MRH43673.1 PDZ domain-containing protein [Aquibacillus halophilus]